MFQYFSEQSQNNENARTCSISSRPLEFREKQRNAFQRNVSHSKPRSLVPENGRNNSSSIRRNRKEKEAQRFRENNNAQLIYVVKYVTNNVILKQLFFQFSLSYPLPMN